MEQDKKQKQLVRPQTSISKSLISEERKESIGVNLYKPLATAPRLETVCRGWTVREGLISVGHKTGSIQVMWSATEKTPKRTGCRTQ